MSQYTFPCIITNYSDVYTAVFPDINNRKVYGHNLYDTLKAASNVLLVEVYSEELQRIKLPEPTNAADIKLNANQFITYVICDTDVLGNVLDLYDDIQADDLLDYFRAKDQQTESDEIDKEKNIALMDEEDEAEEAEEAEEELTSIEEVQAINNIDTDMQDNNFDFIDDIEVKQVEESETNKIVIPEPDKVIDIDEIPEPEQPAIPDVIPRQKPKQYKRYKKK